MITYGLDTSHIKSAASDVTFIHSYRTRRSQQMHAEAPVGRCEGMPSVKQHSRSTTQPTMIPNHLGMCSRCVGRGTSATGNSGQLLTDPETTLPPLLVAPHVCVEAIVDAEAALIGMTCP